MVKLKRELGLFEATAYGIGIIIGAGIYALIGTASGLAGNSLWIAFVIGAVVSMFTGLSYAELSSMFPREAAEYVYVKRAYREELFAFLVGWLIIFTGIISVATVSLGFASYAMSLFGIPTFVSSFGLIALMSFLNFYGIKESSRLNIILIGATIFGLLVVIALGLGKIGSVNYLEMPKGIVGILSATALIFFAYLGFEDIVNVSEETKTARKIIPKALILAVLITTVLYILTSISVVSLANWNKLSQSGAPLAYAASQSFLGENAYLLISIVALFATAGTVLGMLVVTSRMVYGMSNEGSLPKILSTIHKKRRTPWVSILLVTILSMLFLIPNNISLIASITSLGAFITFTVINLSLIWLRYTKPKMHRPFRVPFNIGKYPLVAFFGVFATLFMIFQFDEMLIRIGLVVLVIGAGVYFARKSKLIL